MKSKENKATAVLRLLKKEHDLALAKANAYNPEFNPMAISIIQQEDGNWMGTMQKFSKIVSAREVKPEDVLLKLITHDGLE